MRTISKLPALKTGILLINLGTPQATDFASVRAYLKQFLSDKHVVPARGPVWWLVLRLIILRRRPHSLGRAYDAIWNHDLNESPLRSFTRAQAHALSGRLNSAPDVVVDWAMRYGTPSIKEGIEGLIDQGCERVLLFPLYPQYSISTIGSALNVAYEALTQYIAQPAIRSVPAYFDHPAYINAIATSVRNHHANLDWQPEVTIASLHGLPIDFIKRGDPYQAQCETTVDLLRNELSGDESTLLLTYQSRSNRKEWTGPRTEETLARLASEGIKNLTLFSPGFASDGVETLEELGIRAKQVFLSAGGQNFALIPCLNASDEGMDMLLQLVQENLWR